MLNHHLHAALAKAHTAVSAHQKDSAARRAGGAALVAAAASGDQRAWDALHARFDPMLRRVARGFRLSSHEVDDAVQETWLRLVRHLHRLENPAGVGAWLTTTTRRESLRLLQTATRERPTDEPIGAEQADPGAQIELDALADQSRTATIRAAIDSLPPRDRALLELIYREPPPSYTTIAAALAIPVGSIGPTRARALARLRRHPGIAALATGSSRL